METIKYEGEETRLLEKITDPAIRTRLDEVCEAITKVTKLETIDVKLAEATAAIHSMKNESNADQIFNATGIINLVYLRALTFLEITAASRFETLE
jgi:hypothetical protein